MNILQGWGKEPDQSFYLIHEARIREKDEIDLEIDLGFAIEHRTLLRSATDIAHDLGGVREA